MIARDSSEAAGSTALQVGVMLGSDRVPSWQVTLLQSVLACVGGKATVWVSRPSKVVRTRWSLVYRLFRRLEGEPRGSSPDALGRVTLESLVSVHPGLNIGPGDPARESSLADAVRAANLDILLLLADSSWLSHAGSLARFGCWYFEAAGHAHDPWDGSLAGFPDVIRRHPCFHAALRIRSRDATDLTAFATVSPVDHRSHNLTRNQHLWKCSTFAARALRRCLEIGPAEYLATLPKSVPARGNQGELQLALSFIGYVSWRLRQKSINRRTTERWGLLWRDANSDSAAFSALAPPPDRFWADPHALFVDGAAHVFFEDASRKSGKGHIAVVTRRTDGSFTPATPIIERPYHLSYPFVFRWQGEYYLIPESAENRTIELYRCTQMPHRWEFMHNLMQGFRAYDATLLEHGGCWWMFANVAENEGASSWDELCVFQSDCPISRQWRPHRGNPVISDVRRARPAGPFVREEHRLIRPSQDSSGRYGRALNFNEVLELTEETYREATIRVMEPDWDPSILAVHSYSRAGTLAFIDAIQRETR